VTVGGVVAAKIPIQLTVRDFDLPSTPSLKTAYAVGIGEAAMGHYGTKSISDAQYWELICLYTKEMLLHRVSNENVTWPRVVPDSAGKINWSLPAISTTCNQRYPEFLTGGNPNLLPNGKLPGAQITRARMRDGTSLSTAAVQSVAFYKNYLQHYADMGWKDRLFYYLWDEPPYPSVNGVRRCDQNYSGTASTAWRDVYNKSKFFKDNGIDIPILVTTSRQATEDCFTHYLKVPDYTRYLDIWTVPNKHIDGKPDAGFPFNTNLRGSYDSIITTGKELWWYHACGNHGCSGSETGFVAPMADLQPIYSRMFEWLTYKYQIDYRTPGPSTELYFETVYAYQFATNDPWKNIFYFSGNGDGTYFYPGRPDKIGGTTHIPIASIRMKMLREGIEDYEYLVQAEAKKNKEGTDGKAWIKTSILDPYLTAQDPRDGADKFITYVWNKAPGSAGSVTGLLRAREELAKALSSQPDFEVNLSLSSATVVTGNGMTTSVSIVSRDEFNESVALSCATANPAVTCALNPNSVTPPANGTGSATLSITTLGAAPAGNYTITVQGTSGAQVHQADLALTVLLPPDFKLAAAPLSAAVVAGNSATSPVTVSSLNQFNSAVGLTCATSHPIVTCALSPVSVTPPMNGNGTSTLSIATQSAAPAGGYTVTVQGTSGSLVRQTTVALTVALPPDFRLTVSPTAATVTAGNSAASSVTVSSLNQFNSAVGLTCSTPNPTVTCALNPTSVTPPANGNSTSSLTVTTQGATPTGTYSVTISGASGALVRQGTFALTVTAVTTTPVSESFDRADSTNLGPNWNEYLADFGIGGNQVANLDTASQEAQWTLSLGPNQDISADCKVAAAGNSCGVMARWSSGGNFYYLRLDPGLGNVALIKKVNGIYTTLTTANRTMAYNTLYRLRLVVNGSVLTGYFAGESTPAITVSDASLPAGNYAGIRSYAAAAGATGLDRFNTISLGGSSIESFDRADSTSLGNNWNEYLLNFEISGNQLRNSDTAAQEAQWMPSIGANQDVSVDCRVTVSGNSCGVTARWSNANNFYYALVDPGLGSIALFKKVNGIYTRLAVASRTMSFNTFYRIRLVAQGTSLSVFYNGENTAAISLSDSSLAAGNYAGIRTYASAAAATYLDNLKATAP